MGAGAKTVKPFNAPTRPADSNQLALANIPAQPLRMKIKRLIAPLLLIFALARLRCAPAHRKTRMSSSAYETKDNPMLYSFFNCNDNPMVLGFCKMMIANGTGEKTSKIELVDL